MSAENKSVKTLQLSFNLDIEPWQLAQWRGAFIQMAGWEDDRFHNHKGEKGYHYRYPVIQYRRRKGQAALLAINEGVTAVQQVLAANDWTIEWQGNKQSLMIEDLRMHEDAIAVTEQLQEYRLYKWVALNQENLKKWDTCQHLIERIQLLQPLLRNHLLACLWGLGWEGKETIQVNIQHLHGHRSIRLHGTKFLAFDLSFSTNVTLPHHVGIGKGVSHGQGRLGPIYSAANVQSPRPKRQRKLGVQER